MDQPPVRPGATLERLHATRREFLTRIAQASAALGGSAIAGSAVAQAPADTGAGIPNATIMAGKDSVLAIHSERPLTASVPAEHHNFLVTPTRRTPSMPASIWWVTWKWSACTRSWLISSQRASLGPIR